MGNSATASGLQLDLFSTPAPRAREFWTRIDKIDLGGQTLSAVRGQEFGARIDLEPKDGGWVARWEIGSVDAFEVGGTQRAQRSREDALLCAGDGIQRAAGRLHLTKRASAEIRRWLKGLDAL